MRRTLLAAGMMAAMAVVAPVRAQELKVPEGFRPLFNGKDLTGWHGWAIHDKGANPQEMALSSVEDRKAKIAKWTEDAKKHWSVENGELVNDGNGAYLATEEDLGDIELLIDYRTVAKADSGIYLRGTPQIQIWDYTKEGGKWNLGADKGSGGLWNNSKDAPGKDPSVLADKPLGEWNSFRIRQVGERTWIHLNGKLVVDGARMENFWDRKSPLPKQGKVLLQTHGGEIRWRNIFVRTIPAAEGNEMLKAIGKGEGFNTLFDGTTLDQWTGAAGNCEIKDGAVTCKPGKGGVLHTKEKYANFVARLEYKVPPAGNNGLAIRYPGSGDAAYTGMCELQVLDDTSEKYNMLDPRQYNLSAYGMTPAKRGYMRKVGEWNFAEITVNGSTIIAELNGSRVLETDLSKVDKFMANTPHPGKDLKEGYFGFAGHGDTVAFRNVQIKRLP
jgi:hypothetical protein